MLEECRYSSSEVCLAKITSYYEKTIGCLGVLLLRTSYNSCSAFFECASGAIYTATIKTRVNSLG